MTNAIGFLTVSRTRASEAHGHDHRQVSQPAGPSLASDAPDDLIGGPSAIAESDSGLFTTPDRTPGAQGLQVVELYGIEPWAPDHLHPIYGSAPCFLWKKDKDAPQKNQRNGLEDGGGDSAKPLFANRLSHGACVPVTILDVLLNVEGVGVGERLREFRRGTKRVSSLVCCASIFSLSAI